MQNKLPSVVPSYSHTLDKQEKKTRVRDMALKENIHAVMKNIEEACIRSNRNPEDITVVAVTKYVDVQTTNALIEQGITHLGENRDQPFLTKHEAIGNQVTWHFIGTLQSRKVKNIIDKVDYIHSLDRLSLAKEIQKRAQKKVKCFVQVNVSEEETKHGLSVHEVLPFIEQLEQFNNIEVVGLMTMAPHTDDEDLIRSVFQKLKALQVEVKNKGYTHAPCEHLSMGMSNDYTIAIEEGATFLRLGTTLVGTNA